jgi:LAGLIDADG endonuclease
MIKLNQQNNINFCFKPFHVANFSFLVDTFKFNSNLICANEHIKSKVVNKFSYNSKNINTLNMIEAPDFKFYSWFAGFCDAEGNFQTTKFKRINKKGIITSIGLKYSFHIGLHLRDKELLKLIQSKLNNIGKVYEYNEKEEAHLAVYKIEELKWLIENVLSKYPLLSSYQRLRFEQMRIGVVNDLKRLDTLDDFQKILVDPSSLPTVDSLSLAPGLLNAEPGVGEDEYFKNWACGFLNGEVSFTYGVNNNKNFPRINLEHTDENAIELIKNVLSLNLKTYTRTRGLRKTTFSISISSSKDIHNTILFLDNLNNLRGYKLIQYNNWKLKYNLL